MPELGEAEPRRRPDAPAEPMPDLPAAPDANVVDEPPMNQERGLHVAQVDPAWEQARRWLLMNRMLTKVEGEMLGEEPDRYANDVDDLATLVDRIASWQLNRDMVLGRQALPETYNADDVTNAHADYRFARGELRQVVKALARRWADEEETDE